MALIVAILVAVFFLPVSCGIVLVAGWQARCAAGAHAGVVDVVAVDRMSLVVAR